MLINNTFKYLILLSDKTILVITIIIFHIFNI